MNAAEMKRAAGRENSGREEVMVLQFRDGEVIRVEFEDAG